MSNMAWSEQELANAAKRVAESMLTSFPSPSECKHVFSDDFEHSMEILRKKSKRALRPLPEFTQNFGCAQLLKSFRAY